MHDDLLDLVEIGHLAHAHIHQRRSGIGYALIRDALPATNATERTLTLTEVDVAGVEPMTSVTPMRLKQREDKVTDGGIADDIVRNAPATEDNYFLVPKVVE